MTATLVAVDRTLCPSCDEPLGVLHVGQPALFRHGGYGESKRSTFALCPACGWSLLAEVVEGRP